MPAVQDTRRPRPQTRERPAGQERTRTRMRARVPSIRRVSPARAREKREIFRVTRVKPTYSNRKLTSALVTFREISTGRVRTVTLDQEQYRGLLIRYNKNKRKGILHRIVAGMAVSPEILGSTLDILKLFA